MPTPGAESEPADIDPACGLRADKIDRAALTLRRGGLVAFPTETVYGVGAAVRNEQAVARIFELKGRPRSRPLLVHVASVQMARACVSRWPARADELTERFWPGPLTLVLPKAAWIPGVVTADGPTVGLRCPGHPVALKLIESLGEPIAATSANRTGHAPALTPQDVRDAFGAACVDILDAGPATGGVPSTILLIGPTPRDDRVVRQGPVDVSFPR